MENNNTEKTNKKLPPNSVEAEEAVIGSILVDNECIDSIVEKINEEDFYRPANRALFKAISALNDNAEPIDIITLKEKLTALGLLDESGGIQNINRVISTVTGSANASYYAEVVKSMSLRRRAISAASSMIENAFNVENDLKVFLDTAEKDIMQISDNSLREKFVPIRNIVSDSLKSIETAFDNKNDVTGLPTGFIDLDHYTAGLQKSDLIILAARPAMGKTSFALTLSQWIGIHNKKSVGIFSLEMSKEQLVTRMLCSEARVSNSKARNGHLGDSDFPKIVEAAAKISESPIYIDDTPALTIRELRAKSRRLSRETDLSLVVVDYLQLMRSPMYSKFREQEIADISRGLKALAKELRIPVLALSQLNRSLESRPDKRPMMSDLRESGSIEQDADIVMFIYRDEVYNKEESEKKGIAEIIIAKHRSGPTGIVETAFFGEYTRFDNLEKQAMPDGFDNNNFSGPPEELDLGDLDI